MYDLFLLKISFVYAIVVRFYRTWYKSHNDIRVQTYLPEGIKFMLTVLFIYYFTILILAFFESIRMAVEFIVY